MEARALPGLDGAVAKRLRLVGHDQAIVDPDDAAESAARLACAERGIEREQARRRLLVVNVAIRAMQIRRKAPERGCPDVARSAVIRDMDVDASLTDTQRRLDRLDRARAIGGAQPKAILHDGKAVTGACVDARIALLFEQLSDFSLGKIRRHHNGKGDDEARIAGGRTALRDAGVDRRRGIARDGAAAAATEKRRGARIEHFQVIGELRHRADRRSRRADRIGLVDRDRRWNAVDAVDLRLVHPIEELARVRRERLDIAALPFGVQRVEDER